MFKKYYKAANDDIQTNRELIDKIFEAAEKPSKTVKFAKIYKIGTAVAAVFVFAAGAFLYPQITRLNEEPIPQVETGQEIEEKVIQKVEKENFYQQTPESVVKQKNSAKTASEPAPEPIIEDENLGIDVASETKDAQPFSIPEGTYARTIEAQPAFDTKEVLFDSFKEVSEEETENVQEFLKATLGEKDEETGNIFLFEIVGKAENMYLGRWKWFVVDHNSLLCDFVLNEELTEMYECIYTENGAVQWNIQNNLVGN